MDSSALQAQLTKALEHCTTELAGIRTNRVTPSLVEHVPIRCYGATMQLHGVASITAPEPMTLMIDVWDTAVLQDVERGLREAELGLSVSVDGQRIRLTLPQLTEERRKELMKCVHEKAEEARIAIRKIREEGMKDLRRTGEGLSEDVVERKEKEIQKSVDEANASVGKIVTTKECDLMTP